MASLGVPVSEQTIPLTADDEAAIVDAVVSVLLETKPALWEANGQTVASAADLAVERLTGGITNALYKADLAAVGTSPSTTVLLRIYGANTEKLIDREFELGSVSAIADAGLGAPLYATFGNGYVYGFLDGRNLEDDELRDEALEALIAARLAEFHRVPRQAGEESPEPMLMPTLRRWLAVVREAYDAGEFADEAKARVEALSFERMSAAIDAQEAVAKNDTVARVTFCHNDLLSGNVILRTPAAEGDPPRVDFIDCEYASYSYNAFDIANHFSEFMGFAVNTDHYPSEAAQLSFCRAYLRSAANGTDLDESAVVALQKSVEAFSPGPHLFWGIWALVQCAYSTIDFDYLAYAERKLGLGFAILNV